MPRADFKLVPFHHNFTANTPALTREFLIDGIPLHGDPSRPEWNDAYIMIQTKGISSEKNDIRINNKSLGGTFDIPFLNSNEESWALWFRQVPANILQSGKNHISIRRWSNGADDFRISNVIVNWREE